MVKPVRGETVVTAKQEYGQRSLGRSDEKEGQPKTKILGSWQKDKNVKLLLAPKGPGHSLPAKLADLWDAEDTVVIEGLASKAGSQKRELCMASFLLYAYNGSSHLLRT